MSDSNSVGIEARVLLLESTLVNLQSNMREIKEENAELYAETQRLVTSIALLNQSVQELVNRGNDRKQITEKLVMFIVGGFIAAFVSWVVRGGLGA